MGTNDTNEAEESAKPKKRKTALSDPAVIAIRTALKNNLDYLFKTRNKSVLRQKYIADRCHAYSPRVTEWRKGISLPSVVQLKILSDIFHVSCDWLLSEHTMHQYKESDLSVRTYYDAMTYLIYMDHRFLDDEDIEITDPIIAYLFEQYRTKTGNVKAKKLPSKEFNLWLTDVFEKFNIPILDVCPETTDYYRSQLGKAEEYDTFVTIVDYYSTHAKEVVEKDKEIQANSTGKKRRKKKRYS